jgi:hypothetical protein
MAGKKEKARALLSELHEKSKLEFVASMKLSPLYLCLGEVDKAFEFLEKAYQEHDSQLYWLRVVPFYGMLQSDPRYQDLLRRMNFPP